MCDDDLPAAMPGGAPNVSPTTPLHDHPLPQAFRVLAGAYALVILLFGGLVLWTVHQMEQNDRKQRAALIAEMDRRTAERRATEERVQRQLSQQREATRVALCSFLANDLDDTPALRALEARFDCPPREGAPQ